VLDQLDLCVRVCSKTHGLKSQIYQYQLSQHPPISYIAKHKEDSENYSLDIKEEGGGGGTFVFKIKR
jgi:hypothetical protein